MKKIEKKKFLSLVFFLDPHGLCPVTTIPVLPCVTSTPIDHKDSEPSLTPIGNPIIKIDESDSSIISTSTQSPTSRFLRKMRKHYINGQVS